MEWHHWIALALLGAALWAFRNRLQRMKTVRGRSGWTEAKGRVLSSSVEAVQVSDGEGGTDTHYEPRIAYEYEVGGRIYRGDRCTGETGLGSRRKVQQFVQDRPAGAEIPVYVNPANPEEAMLTTKEKVDWFAPILFLVLAAAAGLGLFGT